MPKLAELFEEESAPFVSMEYFPPKTEAGVDSLYEKLGRVHEMNPLFIDFTWGAGGSTSDLTLQLTLDAKKKFGIIPNMHLTCTNMEMSKIETALDECKKFGIQNILALRGDPPLGEEKWTAVEGGLTCALDLVQYIREIHGDYFNITVAGYPEGHPNAINQVKNYEGLSPSEKLRCSKTMNEESGEISYFVCSDEDFERELDYLKAKVDAGASAIFTQMFFDAKIFFAFYNACRSKGITVPIIPGLMCINSVAGLYRMAKFCKSALPDELVEAMEQVNQDDVEAVKAFGIEQGYKLSKELLEFGVQGLHYYTLNLEKVVRGIVEKLQPLLKGESVSEGSTPTLATEGSTITVSHNNPLKMDTDSKNTTESSSSIPLAAATSPSVSAASPTIE